MKIHRYSIATAKIGQNYHKEQNFGSMKTKTSTQQEVQSSEIKRCVSTWLKVHHQPQS